MIWTMNDKSLKSSADKKQQIENNMYTDLTEINSQSPAIESRSQLKRKLSDVEPIFIFSNTITMLNTTDKNLKSRSKGESPTAHEVECPNNSAVMDSPNFNRRELKILKMQIAMISDADGDRPIHVAVVQDNLKLVQKLCDVMMKTAISLDLTNYLRQTPLHLAVMLGNVEMVKLLLKCGSSLTLKDRNGNSVVHLAVKTEAKKDVLCLILSHPHVSSILNSMDHEGYTALHYAVLERNKIAVTCLHRSGADMNVTDGKSGRTALIHAILANNIDMVKTLLECDVSVDLADYSGRSAFEFALQVSNKEAIKLLEKKLFSEDFSNSFKPEEVSKEAIDESTAQRTKKLRT